MTPRERVLATLNHEQPDRVPKSSRYSPAILKKFNDEVGANIPDRFLQQDGIKNGLIANEILEEQGIITFEDYFNIEFRHVEFKFQQKINDFLAYHSNLPKDAKIDEWGVAEIPGKSEHYIEMRSPLSEIKNIEEIKKYPWPDPVNDCCQDHLDKLTKEWQKKGYVVAGLMQMTIFEQAWYMRGLENLLIDMMDNNIIAKHLLDKITEIKVTMARRYAEAGVDIIRLGDDIGTQRGLLMSKELWCRWLKPRLLEVITAARSIKPDIFIFYHTDGKVDPIIPELIEIGINILNPVQPECMNVYELHREYGKYLTFWGTIGTQTTLPFATVKEIKELVRERIEKIGRFGGLILGPTHTIQPDVPWKNVVALFKAINEYKII